MWNNIATCRKTKEHWETWRSCETTAENKLANIVEYRVATKVGANGTHGKRLKTTTTRHRGK